MHPARACSVYRVGMQGTQPPPSGWPCCAPTACHCRPLRQVPCMPCTPPLCSPRPATRSPQPMARGPQPPHSNCDGAPGGGGSNSAAGPALHAAAVAAVTRQQRWAGAMGAHRSKPAQLKVVLQGHSGTAPLTSKSPCEAKRKLGGTEGHRCWAWPWEQCSGSPFCVENLFF